MNPLKETIVAAGLARDAYQQRCAEVWTQLQTDDPKLCGEVRKLGLDEEWIAEWVCRPFDHNADSPAMMAATGRRDLVIQMVHRTLNGFSG